MKTKTTQKTKNSSSTKSVTGKSKTNQQKLSDKRRWEYSLYEPIIR